jgi:predicted metal-dependent phosphoesterase TrpH
MAHTRVGQELSTAVRGQRSGISLHSHTHHSKERLGFLPGWVARRPVLSFLARHELARQERRHGHPLDFMQAYWCPPLPPLAVIKSEEQQITTRLDLAPIVSITDHDTIAGSLGLAAVGLGAAYPLSVEWTVPFRGQVFHLGIHNLPPAQAGRFMARFHAATADPDEARLADVLADVTAYESTLVVLNHPLWNAHVDTDQDHSTLSRFVRAYRAFLHATEINGYRSHAENKAALRLGDAWNLPVVAGGDRHGRAPNAVLNVTRATSFDEFVQEVRHDGLSHTVIMPEYREHPATRVLEVLADVLGHHESLDSGQRRWLQRVFVVGGDGQHRPLERYWAEVPLWIRTAVKAASLLGSVTARQAIRLGLPVEDGGVL